MNVWWPASRSESQSSAIVNSAPVVTRRGESTATPQNGVKPTITIDPSAMPSGAELSIGDFQLADGEQQANAVLINTSSYTCTSTPPSLNSPGNDSFGLLYGGPGPS